MERETNELKIGNHTYLVKAYATAREANAIQQAYFKGTKLEVVGEQPKITEFNPNVQFDVKQEMIRQLIVSMDDVSDGIVERILELRDDEFEAVAAELDKLVAKKKS